ncbi:phosphoribosylanthranilate isomerase [Thalassococcus sp. S3]|uniref:phosphoribosylanthranilate isomerase n=1 Tax=Thalassococcus sp. S3 TaxID=2017482 RepID=UPI0010241196|nr:phosphoribosylanthranilate isomerase [Thalassococcus sp. S3]QBF30746.1 phosphoribosylanthranilate isomerase [Thalassococcus sp. S3]
MSPKIAVKICGLSEPTHVAAAVEAGARYVGFVFFPKSPRNIGVDQAARLAQSVPDGVCKVALVVNADDATLDRLIEAVPIDMLQLHGDETPDRVAEVKDRYHLPVMKAVGVADETDLPGLQDHMRAADQVLVDAKPPKGAALPGGNGLAFDWKLIAGRRWPVPWMLAGGLTPENVADAVAMTGAKQVDVSSGVEQAPGIKDPERIRNFLKALD